jgi:two-component system sensor histidine kinase RpfC
MRSLRPTKSMSEVYRMLRSRLRARNDSEHIQSLLRIMAGFACLFYVSVINEYSQPVGALSRAAQLAVGIGIVVGGSLFLAHIIWFPKASRLRRWLGIVHDMSGTGLTIFVLGDSGFAAFSMYIWIVIGNGFRYGVDYLYGSAALALLSFYTVVYFSAYYQSNYGLLALSTFVLAVVIPVYLGSLLKRLQRNLEAARQADRLKTRFLANVSHDLRTPLHVILANCESLTRDLRGSRQHLGPLLDIREAATTLSGLVIDLLDVAKLEAGRIKLEHECFNLVELLGKVMRLHEVAARQHNTEITLAVDSSTPVWIRGDRLKLEQILNNIVSNAVKYTENGYVHIDARAVDGNVADSRKQFVCSIHDTGIGMEAGAAKRIFARFEQADEAYARSYSGAGLGLSIANELVNLMEGSIDVTSSKGEGSCFTVSVPIHPQSEPVYEQHESCPAALLLVVCAPERQAHWRHRVKDDMLSGATVHGTPAATAAALRSVHRVSGRACVLVDARGMENCLHDILASIASCSHSDNIAYLLANATGATADWKRYREFRSRAESDSVDSISQMLAIVHWTSRNEPSDMPVEEDEFHYASSLRGRRILVADDNELNRRVIANVLNRVDTRVAEARNGREALAILISERVDAAILDVQMPDMTGVEVMLASAAQSERPPVPFIALTADTTDECRSQCLAAGADSVLYKPVDAQSLCRELDRVMTRQNKPQDCELSSALPGELPIGLLNYTLLQELAMSAQHPEYMTSLVACFKKDGGQLLGELSKILQGGDLSGGRALLHRLKGMSSAIGADAIAELCGETLASSDECLCSSRHALVDRLSRLHDEAGEALERFLLSKPSRRALNRPPLYLARSLPE